MKATQLARKAGAVAATVNSGSGDTSASYGDRTAVSEGIEPFEGTPVINPSPSSPTDMQEETATPLPSFFAHIEPESDRDERTAEQFDLAAAPTTMD